MTPPQMDTLMIQNGVCYGQTVTGTDIQQQNTSWVQTGEAVPPNHNPKGNTVTAQVTVLPLGATLSLLR